MRFRRDRPNTEPTTEHRLDSNQVRFLGFVLLIKASDAKERESKVRFKKTQRSIVNQAAKQITNNYPSHNPDQNTANIVLGETELGAVEEALGFIVKLDQERKPDSRLTIRLGTIGLNASSAEIASHSQKVVDNVGEAARNLQELFGFVEPQ